MIIASMLHSLVVIVIATFMHSYFYVCDYCTNIFRWKLLSNLLKSDV